MNDINNIEWDSLGYPQIPELFQNLIVADEKIQIQAFYRIEAEVILGGFDWESFDLGKGIETVIRNDTQLFLVPFLIELLRPEVNSIKTDILYLLSRLMSYESLIDANETYKKYVAKLRHLIWEGRFHYVALLSHDELKVRTSALTLMMDFNEAIYIVEAYNLVASQFHPPIPSKFR